MTHDLAIVAVVALVTLAIRALPFLLFSHGNPPRVITYLGRVLPPTVMAILVVYCLKGVSFGALSGFAPALLAVAATAALHVWKRSTLLSIAGGTAVYMLLIRMIV